MQLIIDKLKKSFGNNEVLKDISFTFNEGNIYALLGRNGSGKTTLFNCLNSEIDYDKGDVFVIDDNKNERPINYDDIGYVSATPDLPEFLTGYEMIKFFIDINNDNESVTQSPNDFLDLVDIDKDARNRLIKDYSLGMKNKIQMLSFVITRPPIILLDEPITSLDIIAAAQMKKIIKKMKNNHIIIFSTHLMSLASELGDTIVILNDGILNNIENISDDSEVLEEKVIKILGNGE